MCYIAEKLNSEGILWGVGASILLNHYGLIDKPNDIDILVDIKDIEKADRILSHLGKKKLREEVDTYSTIYFYEYIVNGIDIDIMAGHTINYDNYIYKYIFDEQSITGVKKFKYIDIPLTSLEDWYVIYQLIPNRENKVKIIESYLLENGVKNPILLKRATENGLPNPVKYKIEELLNKNL